MQSKNEFKYSGNDSKTLLNVPSGSIVEVSGDAGLIVEGDVGRDTIVRCRDNGIIVFGGKHHPDGLEITIANNGEVHFTFAPPPKSVKWIVSGNGKVYSDDTIYSTDTPSTGEASKGSKSEKKSPNSGNINIKQNAVVEKGASVAMSIKNIKSPGDICASQTMDSDNESALNKDDAKEFNPGQLAPVNVFYRQAVEFGNNPRHNIPKPAAAQELRQSSQTMSGFFAGGSIKAVQSNDDKSTRAFVRSGPSRLDEMTSGNATMSNMKAGRGIDARQNPERQVASRSTNESQTVQPERSRDASQNPDVANVIDPDLKPIYVNGGCFVDGICSQARSGNKLLNANIGNRIFSKDCIECLGDGRYKITPAINFFPPHMRSHSFVTGLNSEQTNQSLVRATVDGIKYEGKEILINKKEVFVDGIKQSGDESKTSPQP